MGSHEPTAARPCAHPLAHVCQPHGQPLASTTRCPPCAAFAHICQSHGPSVCAHCSTNILYGRPQPRSSTHPPSRWRRAPTCSCTRAASAGLELPAPRRAVEQLGTERHAARRGPLQLARRAGSRADPRREPRSRRAPLSDRDRLPQLAARERCSELRREGHEQLGRQIKQPHRPPDTRMGARSPCGAHARARRLHPRAHRCAPLAHRCARAVQIVRIRSRISSSRQSSAGSQPLPRWRHLVRPVGLVPKAEASAQQYP
jgi:hypothetical protein